MRIVETKKKKTSEKQTQQSAQLTSKFLFFPPSSPDPRSRTNFEVDWADCRVCTSLVLVDWRYACGALLCQSVSERMSESERVGERVRE